LAKDHNDPDQRVLLQHRNRKHGAIAGKLRASHCSWIPLKVGRCRLGIVDLHHLFREGCSAQGGFRVGTNHRYAPPVLRECRRCVVQADATKLVPFPEEQVGKSSFAQVRRFRQDSLEHRF
jgi:hypothetical protein